ACHKAAAGSVGHGKARLAANRARPSIGADSAAARARTAAVSTASARSLPPTARRSAAAEPRSRASSAALGGAKVQASGMALLTCAIEKLQKVANTTSGPTGPMGAARPAKYPIQNPSYHAPDSAARTSGEK